MFRALPGDFLVFESSTLERRPSTSRSKLSSISKRPLSPKPCTTTCGPHHFRTSFPFPFPKTRKIGTIRTSYRLRNLAIHRGYPILSSSHQDLRASSEFRSSRTLDLVLEPDLQVFESAIETPSGFGSIDSHDCNAAHETGAPVRFRTPYASPFPMRPLVLL